MSVLGVGNVKVRWSGPMCVLDLEEKLGDGNKRACLLKRNRKIHCQGTGYKQFPICIGLKNIKDGFSFFIRDVLSAGERQVEMRRNAVTPTDSIAGGDCCLLPSSPLKYAKFMLNVAIEVSKTTSNSYTEIDNNKFA
ncbi:hypothetical protein KM043_012616 [Ampulex compressa]|nr:hypothetical protein KM043_012616 [Ampulex compressa]